MSELLMYNPRTLEMRYISSHQGEVKERLEGEGWIPNPCLIHMHHPRPAAGQQPDVNIPVQDKKTWEDKGYYANPTMIYHPLEGTKAVSEEDAKKAFKNGWYASPAMFPGNDLGKLKTLVSKEAA